MPASLRNVLLLLACGFATQAFALTKVTDPDAPRSLPEAGPVSVRWTDPAQFTEIRLSGNTLESSRGRWVHDLAAYLRKRAEARLPNGERLDVEIRDVDRAGDYEPGRSVRFNDVRVMREIYPPRIALAFTRTGANGAVIDQGERKLSNPAYLSMATGVGDSDPLRYEKALIDQWLRREFPNKR